MRASLIAVLVLSVYCVDRGAMADVGGAPPTAAISVCEILAHPLQYAGREVEVVGIYGRAPHQRILFDPSCAYSELAVRLAGGKEALEDDEQLQDTLKNKDAFRISAVYRGLIEAKKYVQPCSGASCYRVAISDARLVSAIRVAVP